MNIRQLACYVGLTWVLLACASTEFSIPAVTGSTDGARQPGKIIWHDLLTDTPAATRAFYAGLFGWEFQALDGINYTLIKHRGELIGGMVDQNQLPAEADISQWVALFSVSDVALATRRVREAGGTVFTPPTSLGERGTIAVVADPQGAVLALLETRYGDPPDTDGLPPAGRFLWNELWTGEVDAAARFYTGLVSLSSQPVRLEAGDEPVEYRILAAGERPRAGIRTRPVEDLDPRWVSYLRVTDEAEMKAILSRVDALGGQVVVPATARPEGGLVAVITGPSGAGIALQTWEPGQALAEGRESL